MAKHIVDGSGITAACARCGIAPRTHREWMEKGEAGDDDYLAYWAAVTIGLDDRTQELLERCDKDGRHDAQNRWVVERINRREYRLPKEVELSGPDKGPVDLKARNEAYQARLAALFGVAQVAADAAAEDVDE